MSNTIIAIVTGANRGIGQAICQTLASTIQEPMVIYAASRKGANLEIQTTSKEIQVKYPKLDITDNTSIQNLAKSIKKDHSGVNVLINNAGVNLDDDYTPVNVERTLNTNYRGTLQMCQTFVPLLKRDGRIVNLSSVASSLNPYSKEIQERFRSKDMTLADLENLAKEYDRCAQDGTESEKGWTRKAYSVSKACVNALTAVLAREHPGLIINACCPGWVSTDMGAIMGNPPKSPSDGATVPIRLGFQDTDGVTGRYWSNRSISSTKDGRVVTW